MSNLQQDKQVLLLNDPAAMDLSLNGGKTANLSKLIHAGFPVPEGFCITTETYQHLVDDQDIVRLIDELESVGPLEAERMRDLAANLRERIRAREISADTTQTIESLIEAEESYVVRSSATAEDLPNMSFAGQHDTVLDVTGVDAVVEAILKCMASLFTDRAVSYRSANNIAHKEVSMAVVVQRMIDADSSGVLFTADPTTGKRTVASIDAASGLGEAVVSGTVTSDNVLVTRETGEILEYRMGSRDEGAEDADNARVLSNEQVKTLVTYGNAIEQLFGSPQDIEWSIAGNQFWMLQSRPITTLAPIPLPPPYEDALHVYYSWNHRQGMTEAMPPLVVDYWLRTMESLFNRIGYTPATGPVGATAGGMVYIDVTPFIRSNRIAPQMLEGLKDFDRQAIPPLEAVRKHRYDELSKASILRGVSFGHSLSAGLRLAGVVLRSVGVIIRGLIGKHYEQAPARGRRWADDLAERMIREIRSGQTEHKRLAISLEKNREYLWEAVKQWLMLWNIYFYRSALKRCSPRSEEEFEALERGLRENVTTTMMLELGDITDIARRNPEVEQATVNGCKLDDMRKMEGGEEFISAFDGFLERYGFRAPAEIEFSHPRYNEDPSSLLSTIQASLKAGERADHRKHLERLEAEAEEAITRLEQAAGRGILRPLRRRLVRPFALRYRSYLSLREITKYALAQLLAETRRQILTVGKHLESEGGIPDAECVWFYRFDELLLALENPSEPLDIDIQTRRAEYLQSKQKVSPGVITSDGEIPRGDRAVDSAADGLMGIPTSGGVAEGIARVIYNPSNAILESGEILVAPHTDPGWTPLFLNAAGLITNVGGVMTHGSLVAREYGIPSVVLAEATEKLETGQRIRMDGHRGIVEILEVE